VGLWDENNHHKTDHTYNLFGNVIQYYGVDDHEKVHGRKRDILIINEANQVDEETIDQLSPRTRHRIICDFNPALGAEHWLDKYIDKYGVLITTYKNNPFLTKAQVEDIESKKDNPYWWTIYGTGQRAKVQGAVFENWEVGEFQGEDYSFGMDFGYSNDPSTLIKVSIDKRNRIIYADECLYETHLTTTDLYNVCKQVAKDKLIVADSAEPRLIAELRSKGINIQGTKKGQGSVVEGVVMMNDYKIIVTERSNNLRKELSNYRWADKGKTVPIDDNNHAIDGLRYNVMFYISRPNYGKYAVG
jgi:phage terminase large subunit